jgi:hypothetical protein
MTEGVRVVSQWASLLENFNTSALDFYTLVEARVTAREAPDLKLGRKNLSEGSIFSSSREYLLVRRKKLTFAVCSAPYGTGQFFSWWLLEEEPFFARMLSALPFVGRMFEAWFSRVTFYQADTTAMFKLTIQNAVREAIEEVTNAKGRRLLPDELTPAA